MYVNVCIHIYVHVCIHIGVQLYSILVCINLYVCMHLYICTICKHMYTHVYTAMCTYLCGMALCPMGRVTSSAPSSSLDGSIWLICRLWLPKATSLSTYGDAIPLLNSFIYFFIKRTMHVLADRITLSQALIIINLPTWRSNSLVAAPPLMGCVTLVVDTIMSPSFTATSLDPEWQT